MSTPGAPASARWRSVALVALLVIMVGLAVVALGRAYGTRAFFSGDEGLKSAQRSALAAGHAWLADPARGLGSNTSTTQLQAALSDPLLPDVMASATDFEIGAHRPGQLTPWRPPFVRPCGQGLCSVWRNPVVHAGSWLERFGGPPLAAMVSWLGLVLWLWATARLGAFFGASPVWLALSFLITSPAWLYGVVFWEHAPAAGVVTLALAWAFGAVWRRPTFVHSTPSSGVKSISTVSLFHGIAAAGVGALVACAALSRPESALLALICLPIARRHRHKAEVAAWIGGATIVALVLLFALGDGLSAWLSNNAAVASAGEAPLRRLASQAASLLGGGRGVPQAGPLGVAMPLVALPVAWVVAFVAGLSLVTAAWLPAHILRGLGWAVLVTTGCALVVTLQDPNAQLVGLVLAAPVVWLGLLAALSERASPPPSQQNEPAHGDDEAAEFSLSRRHLAGWLVASLVVALLTAPNDGGSQWGPRYLLPWMGPACALALSAHASWRWLVRLALIIGLVAQLGGARHLDHQQQDKAAALRWLQASPAKVLVSQAWYTPQELASLSLDQGWTLALASDLSGLQLALRNLAAQRTAWWVFAASPRLDARRLLQRGGRWRVVGSRDVAFPPAQVRLHLVARAQ